jgi:uncharacterized protein YbjT (DUF2867 family)
MAAPMKIAVAGATGRVGHHVVDVLKERGHEVAPMSRSTGVDIATGEGLADALTGVECIVDAASWPTDEQEPATEYFTTATRNLQEEGMRAGVERIVVVSIIGTDRFAGGYGAAKVVHEQAMLAGPIPALILRASQFHEFVEVLVQWGTRDGVAYVPKFRTQLVAGRTVAEALADLATNAAPAVSADPPFPEIAGPREESLVDAATLLATRRGLPIRIEGVSNPNDPNAAVYESGALLPSPHATLAGPTFKEWLDSIS